MLSHYKAVVWETGDDIILRAPGQVRRHHGQGRAGHRTVRPRLPQRGRQAAGHRQVRPVRPGGQRRRTSTTRSQPPECTTPKAYPCLPLLNDFLQYWLGAYTYVDGGGTGTDGEPVPARRATRTRSPASPATLNGAGSADNQDHTASFLTTSSFLPPAQFPQFASVAPGGLGPAGAAPFDPHTGDWYVYSGQADESATSG